MKMKQIQSVLLCTALTAALAAGTASAASAQEKKTIKLFQYKAEISEQLEALAEEYMELHPEIDLQVESVTSDNYNTLLKTKFASGEAPDIFNNQGYTEFELWKDNLADLSDEVWVENMSSITVDGISDEEGRIYGLPLYLEGLNFCYNVRLFEQAGITEIPKTLDELDQCCTQLEEAGIPAIIVSLNDWYNMGVFCADIPAAHQPDVQAFVDGLNDGSLTFEENEIYNEWVDLIDVMVKHQYKDPLTTTFPDQISQMANEEAAITLCNNGSWLAFTQINPDLDLDFMCAPINNDAEFNDVFYVGPSTYWCVNNESESAEEAKDFLEWLVTSERGQYYLTEEFGFVSGLTNIPASEEFVGKLGVSVANAVAEEKVLGYEWPRYPSGMTEELGVWIQKYVSGNCSREEMLKGFTESWQMLAQ